MKIEDLLVQSQVDEGVGSVIGKGIGAVSRGIGAVASVPQGIGRAIKKGYQGGVAAIGRDAPASTAPAGTATPAPSSTTQVAPAQSGFGAGLSNLGSSLAGATGVPTAGNGGATGATAAGTNAAAAGNTAGTTNVSLLQDKKFMGSLQALKGGDVEKVRAVLQSRVAVAEGVMGNIGKGIKNFGKGLKFGATNPQAASNLSKNPNTGTMTKAGRVAGAGINRAGSAVAQGATWAKDKTVQGVKALPGAIAAAPTTIAGVAGRAAATGTQMKQAYQDARGGYMTIQDLQRTIATMSPKDAGEALQFFNSIHPAATPAAPAAGAPNLQVQQGGKSATPESIDELASMKNMLDILKKR
jgi:hypothetical protein